MLIQKVIFGTWDFSRKNKKTVPLGLRAAASVTDRAIQKKLFGSGMTT